MIVIKDNDQLYKKYLDVDFFTFPGGEIHFKVEKNLVI